MSREQTEPLDESFPIRKNESIFDNFLSPFFDETQHYAYAAYSQLSRPR